MTRLFASLPPAAFLGFTAALLILGALGGEVAKLAHLPLPWMMGSLAISALVVSVLPHRIPEGYRFPVSLRMGFIAVIGVMIGAQVDGALFAQWPDMMVSLAGVTLFVFIAHALNYWLFRRVGGYDRVTAFYCGTPGGVLESIAMGEAAGADVRVLAVQQFLRIILVVTTVPIGLSLLHGAPLGSSAGLTFSKGATDLSAIPIVLVIGAVGLALGSVLRLPAAHLTGSLALAATLSVLGLVDLNPPGWLIAVAQVVIGVSLGVRFMGVTRRMLRVAIGLAAVSVTGMLALGVAFALAIHSVTGQSSEVLVLSFAPGGVTEMGLVALSLAANPAMVAFHHLYRITLTVLEMSILGRWLKMSGG